MNNNRVARGTEAEMMVATRAVKNGFTVCTPLSHASEYDLIIDSGKLHRIQVKRAYEVNNHGTKVLCIETRRILVKHSGKKGSVAGSYSIDGYDYLIAVDCDNDNYWIIPKCETSQYKAQIYLTSKQEKFKNQWSLLGADVSS